MEQKTALIAAMMFMFIFIFVSSPLQASDVLSTVEMKIKIGYCPSGMLETSVAKEKKFYAKYLPNITVDWHYGLYSLHLIKAWMKGELQIAYFGDMPSIILQSKVKNTKVVTAAVYPQGQISTIFVPHQSRVEKVKQLNGKTIATAMASSHHRILDVIAQKEGIHFKIVHRKPLDAFTDLQQGNIDGLIYWPPFIELAKHKNIGKMLMPNATKYEPEVNAIWPLVISERFIKKYPEIVKGLVKAEKDLHDFMRTNPEEAANIVYEALDKKLPLQVIKGSLASYRYTDKLEKKHIDTIQQGIDFLKEKEIIRESFSAKEWISY